MICYFLCSRHLFICLLVYFFRTNYFTVEELKRLLLGVKYEIDLGTNENAFHTFQTFSPSYNPLLKETLRETQKWGGANIEKNILFS